MTWKNVHHLWLLFPAFFQRWWTFLKATWIDWKYFRWTWWILKMLGFGQSPFQLYVKVNMMHHQRLVLVQCQKLGMWHKSLDVPSLRCLPPFLADFSAAMNFKLNGFNTFRGFRDLRLLVKQELASGELIWCCKYSANECRLWEPRDSPTDMYLWQH